MSRRKEFKVRLIGDEGSEVAAIKPSFDVTAAFGKKGRIPVKGTVNGVPFRSSLMNMGEGHMMVVNAELRKAAGCEAGDLVDVVMERDDDERSVDVPTYLMKIIESDSKASEFWKKLSFTHRKEYVREIDGAAKPETRERRIQAMMESLRKGERKQ